MRLQKETICQDTQYMLEQFYRHDPEALFSALSDDCVWLNVGNLLVSGKEAIKSCFKNGFIMPVYSMKHVKFRLIETGSENQLLVLGQYSLYPSADSGMISAPDQRISCCFRREEKGFRLYHIHASNEWSELVEDEVYPVRMSRQTYRYVQKLLDKNVKKTSPKLVIQQNNTADFIDTSLLVYVEAMGKSTILHMIGETREVSIPFREILQKLPPQFCQLHRSYAVNCDYAENIVRYTLTLVTKEQLPIPKLRYKEVYEEITATISQNKQKH